MELGNGKERYFTASNGAMSAEQWKSERGEYESAYYSIDTGKGTIQTKEEFPYQTPCYFIEPVPVTAENIDEVIIGSDFHTEEDVYLNTKESQ